jgi:hypothetical protein
LSRRCPRKRNARQIDAAHKEHRAGRAENREQHRLDIRHDLFRQRNHRYSGLSCVDARVLPLQILPDGFELGVGLLHRHVRF